MFLFFLDPFIYATKTKEINRSTLREDLSSFINGYQQKLGSPHLEHKNRWKELPWGFKIY